APNTTVVPDADATKSPGAKEPTGKAKDSSAVRPEGRSRTDSGSSSSTTTTPAGANIQQVPDTDVTKSPGAKEPAGGSRY
ncbi:MAG TPA: hypothetical protein VGQ88_02510, partial [Burkholderiales bacterium]|nr:hypothetical protein [Burkholderiales bacterium]